MHRVWAIIERDLRRFRRSPVLVIVSIIMPLVQLIVLGYAFGGKIKNLKVGVIDEDRGIPALKLREMCQAVAANAYTFDTISYTDKSAVLRDLRNGKVNGVLNIPPQFSRKVLAGANPRIALVEDNTDQFSASALEANLGIDARGVQLPRRSAARDGRCVSFGCRGLPVCTVHPVSVARDDRAVDLCLGDDRRRHYFHR